jgi:hypothetical protein
MLKKLQRLRAAAAASQSSAPARASSSRDVSFDAPLTRVLANEVGAGASSRLLQEVSAAAVAESGSAGVSSSCLPWVDVLFVFYPSVF